MKTDIYVGNPYQIDYEPTFGPRDKRFRLWWRHMKKMRERRKYLRKLKSKERVAV